MKKLLTMCMLVACVSACEQLTEQPVEILAADGGTVIAACFPDRWVKCVYRACPNGYDVVRDVDGSYPSIIKCKP